jgi:hypothetical protein
MDEQMAISGIKAALEILAGSGVRYIFGNPGTTELPLMDALVDYKKIKYILFILNSPFQTNYFAAYTTKNNITSKKSNTKNTKNYLSFKMY